jgi:ribosomal protein S2
MSKHTFLNHLFKTNSHLLGNNQVNSNLSPFLIGSLGSSSFLDLIKVLPLLKRSLLLVREVFSNKGRVVLIIDHSIPRLLEDSLNKFFIVKRGGWSEGTLSNFSVVKKTCNNFQTISKREPKGTNNLSKKTRNQMNKFFKKFKTIGYLSDAPRLVITLFPIVNPLFFREIQLLNIPIISLGTQTLNKSASLPVDYPIPLNHRNTFLLNFVIRLLLNEAQKGKGLLVRKYKIRKLSTTERLAFIGSFKPF